MAKRFRAKRFDDVAYAARLLRALAVSLLFVTTAGAIELDIVYPTAGDTIAAAAIDSNFIFGRVSPPQARLFINGERTEVYENGAFISFLPLQHGVFTYHCRAILGVDTLFFDRTVYYSSPPKLIPADSAAIDSTALQPSADAALLPGDVVNLGFRGAPGCSAWCAIEGVSQLVPMLPSPKSGGMYWGEAVFGQGGVLQQPQDPCLYRGSYVLQQGDSCDNAEIRFYLVDQNGDTADVAAPGRLSLWKDGVPQIAETAMDLTVLRTGPHKSYYYFLPKGVKLWLCGKIGRSYRVRLAPGHEAWVEDYKVRLLPPGAAPPRRYVRLARSENFARKVRVMLYTGERVPFRIQQSSSPQSLTVFFYGVTADTYWIRRTFDDPLIREIRWTQESADVYSLTIELKQKNQWGYNADYNDDDNFYLDIKKTPHISRRRRSSLKNIKILIDPGHNPDTGAVGPTRFEEREANLLLAMVVADKLHKKGAVVEFTRRGHDGLALAERMQFAMQSDADILLSLHHNAIPAGVNPFKSRGSSVYYYHPQSYELAGRIHSELLKTLKLNDFGLYWDNLAMCRPTQMPAILIEPAFMMHPEEEMLIRTKEYREKCADAIIRALQDFLHDFRE